MVKLYECVIRVSSLPFSFSRQQKHNVFCYFYLMKTTVKNLVLKLDKASQKNSCWQVLAGLERFGLFIYSRFLRVFIFPEAITRIGYYYFIQV